MSNEPDEYAPLRRYSDIDPEEKLRTFPPETFVKFKIVVATEEDRQQVVSLAKYLHDEGWHEGIGGDGPDGDIVLFNQLRHVYLSPEWVEVRPEEF